MRVEYSISNKIDEVKEGWYTVLFLEIMFAFFSTLRRLSYLFRKISLLFGKVSKTTLLEVPSLGQRL